MSSTYYEVGVEFRPPQPVVKTARFVARHPLAVALTFVVLIGGAIEALLLLRLATQLSLEPLAPGTAALVFDLTDPLVSPFREFEASGTTKTTGVVNFATLVAIEGYFVITLATLVLLIAVAFAAAVWRFLRRHLLRPAPRAGA